MSAWLVCLAAIGADHEPFALDWFQETPAYRRLLKEGAAEDPGVPGVRLTKKEIDTFLARAKVTPKEMKWVEKYASPLSPKRQRARVRSVMDVLLSRTRVDLGRKFSKKHADDLERVSKKYDVAVEDLVSMMNAESRFGEVQGTYVVANVFVANMAYLSKAEAAAKARGDYDQPGAVSREKNAKRVAKRERYAAKNLATLLKYARARDADPMEFTGSWAGAIGITQFMPASLKWAADGDGNGVIDLSTVPDAIASTANYLVSHGYKRGKLAARKKAFRAYNPNSEYVRAIVAYADRFSAR